METIETDANFFGETDNTLDAYLEELDSPKTPRFINPRWIWKRLHMSKYDLRDWVNAGFIPNELLHKKKDRSVFTKEGAILAGHIWYFQENGSPLKQAVSKAQRFVRGERPF